MSTTRNRRARRRAQLPDRRIFRIGVLGVVGRKAHVRLIRDRKNGSLHLVLLAHWIIPPNAWNWLVPPIPRAETRIETCSEHATQRLVHAPLSLNAGPQTWTAPSNPQPRLPPSTGGQKEMR